MTAYEKPFTILFAVNVLALGLDEQGGRAVNLMPADVPQDVYTRVLEGVIEQVRVQPLHLVCMSVL